MQASAPSTARRDDRETRCASPENGEALACFSVSPRYFSYVPPSIQRDALRDSPRLSSKSRGREANAEFYDPVSLSVD